MKKLSSLKNVITLNSKETSLIRGGKCCVSIDMLLANSSSGGSSVTTSKSEKG